MTTTKSRDQLLDQLHDLISQLSDEQLENTIDSLAWKVRENQETEGEALSAGGQMEKAYQVHAANADIGGFHVDGCFYCGGNHPSDCCPDSSAKDECWKGMA